MATPVTCCGSMPRVRSRVWMNTPYSSAVCSRRLVSRHDTSEPLTVIDAHPRIGVADLDHEQHPASALSRPSPRARHHPRQRAAADVDEQRPVPVHVHGHPVPAVRQAHARADRARPAPPRVPQRAEASGQPRVVAHVKRGQHGAPRTPRGVVGAPGEQPEGGRRARQLRRKGALVDVDPDPEDRVLHPPVGAADRVGQDSADLAPADEHVIRPADAAHARPPPTRAHR